MTRSCHTPGMTLLRPASGEHCRGNGPSADVLAWRLCRLLEAGYPRQLAETLASAREVDLHALLELVDRGCPPALAARIMSPITEADRP